MANGNCVETGMEETGQLKPFERTKYYYAKLMTVKDFETEQSYSMGKDHLPHWLIDGVGLVCGLEVSEPKLVDGKFRIKISPGVALDCCGREIVVEGGTFEVEGSPVEGINYVYLKYKECLKEPVPALSNPSACEEVCCYSRIKETFELFLRTPVGRAGFLGIDTYAGRATLYWVLGQALARSFEVVETRFYTPTTTDFISELTALMAQGVDMIYAVGTSQHGGQIKKCLAELGFKGQFEFTEAAIPPSLSPEPGVHYYERCLTNCPTCTNPEVFLCSISMHASVVNVDMEVTRKCRSVIYSNPMLYHLLKAHLTDMNNPHQVTASLIGALKSVDGVENPGGDIDLVKKNAITIEPDKTNKKITIGESHSGKSDNPHDVTAQQVGALRSVDGVENPGGDIDLFAGTGIVIEHPPIPHGAAPQIKISAMAGATRGGISLTIPKATISERAIVPGYYIKEDIRHYLDTQFPPGVILGLVIPSGMIVMEQDFITQRPIISRLAEELNVSLPPQVWFKALAVDNNKFNIVAVNMDTNNAATITICWWAFPARQIRLWPDTDIIGTINKVRGEEVIKNIAAERKIPVEEVSNVIDNMMETISAQPEGITLSDIATSINVKEETIKPVVDALVESAMLKFTGRGAAKKFILEQ